MVKVFSLANNTDSLIGTLGIRLYLQQHSQGRCDKNPNRIVFGLQKAMHYLHQKHYQFYLRC